MPSKKLIALAGVVLVGGCATTPTKMDVGKVFSVKSTFGQAFTVNTAGPGGIDSKLLSAQQTPAGVTFEPADCAQYGGGQTVSPDLKGNMAAVTAEGEGNRFIVIAIEMSEPVRFDSGAVDTCRHFEFTGPNVRGVVDVVDAPQIDGAQTFATHVVEAVGGGVGDLYSYVAYLEHGLVRVTANPLVVPNQDVVPVNVQRAQQLLTDSVAAVRG